MKKHIYIILLCGLTLASCRGTNGLYSDYERPDSLGIPEGLFRDTASTDGVLAADTLNFGNMPWHEFFTDSRLQALIVRALEANIDLRKADITIRQAEQGLKVSRLAFFPTVALSPQGTISSYDFGKASKTYSIPVQASWQADIFGTMRNAKKQSEMTLYQTRAAKQATQTAIICAVANMYYTLEMLDEQIATTRATSEIWNKNVEAMDAMWQAGWTNAAAVSQTKANRLSILNSIPTMENSVRQTENALCALLHEAPHAIERGTLAEARMPENIGVGVPLQLLSNRPDVRAAELQMAYAYYGVLGARGAFYPQLTISGSAGWTNNVGMIVNPAKILATAVGSLTQPIFAQGKLKANLEIAKLQQEAAQLSFEQAVLDAGNEVNTALANYQTAASRIAGNEELVSELQKAVETTEFIFRTDNTVSYLETLSAQQSLLQAQLNLISCRFDKLQAAISLYQALGGGSLEAEFEPEENKENQ
ncbi:MAG: TolC family protein [Alloprevotella sp.]|nr:TolC family protein [Alloprevotella sp.]